MKTSHTLAETKTSHTLLKSLAETKTSYTLAQNPKLPILRPKLKHLKLQQKPEPLKLYQKTKLPILAETKTFHTLAQNPKPPTL